jgi:UTP--glucose-1-phosphate uridylyltransferase
MVTIVDKPVIQYVVEEAIAAGMTKIVLVTRSGKEAIENHFDSHFELETQLQKQGKVTLLKSIHEIIPRHVELLSVRQPNAAGLGDAIRCAAPAVGNQPFAVMLPDVLFNTQDDAKWNMRTMIEAYNENGSAQILAETVPDALVDRYGIIDCGQNALAVGESAPVHNLVEKPVLGTAPSNLSIVGRYVLPPTVFELLKNTSRGAGGEIQLTDALLQLLKTSRMQALMMRGRSFDCGNKLGYLQANVALGLQDRTIAEDMTSFIRALLDERNDPRTDASLAEVA